MKLRPIKLEDVFIPEFNGNRGLPRDEQITVEIKSHMSPFQITKNKRFIRRGAETIVEYDDAVIFLNHVGKISNLEDGHSVKIIDGIALLDSKDKRLYDLVIEIRNYLFTAGEEMEPGEN